MSDVVFISMPFGAILWPSFGLSLLKAGLARGGTRSRVLYFTFPFAERIGEKLYMKISDGEDPPKTDLVGEWIFASAVFGPGRLDDEGYIDNVLRRPAANHRTEPLPESLIRRLPSIRAEVDGFLDECVRKVLRMRPRVIGFSSVFQQQMASLALARRLKEKLPESLIVFGGGNCEGIMGAEMISRFPFIDAVVSGEGDRIVPELVTRAMAGRPLDGLQGVYCRDGSESLPAAGRVSTAPPVQSMDDLPYADFSDFFRQFRASPLEQRWVPGVFFETARGCWWGEKQHCTFCGLNGATMQFRSKSADRALAELTHLTKKHPGSTIYITDNILEMGYFKNLLPELEKRRLGISLFYETKANLRRDQVRQLRDAGVLKIQPGIESFSDNVLKIMRKGVSSIQNVQLLKWCKEMGVPPIWNLIWGFPGEPPEDYERMAEMVPLFTHLPPPLLSGNIRIDRFSPNFNEAEELGFTDVEPMPAYRYLYDLSPGAIANLAYFFTYRYREKRDVESYTHLLRGRLEEWRSAYSGSDLFFVDTDSRLLIWDLRPAARELLTMLSGRDRELYLTCDAARSPASLVRGGSGNGGNGDAPSETGIARALDRLVKRGLMFRDGGRYLSLAVPLGDYSPGREVRERFFEAVREHGPVSTQGIRINLLSRNGGKRRREAVRNRGAEARRKLTPSRFSWGEGKNELVIEG